MYFPYLRGRQFELIALRELIENNLIGTNIIPIIEPIKLSSTLIKTIEMFVKNHKEIAVIHNPQVGNFTDELNSDDKNSIKVKYIELLRQNFVIKSHILNTNTSNELKNLLNVGLDKEQLLLIAKKRDYVDEYTKEFYIDIPRYNLIPDERIFKRTISDNKILLDDKFIKQVRNVDYKDDYDQFFSDDHLYYYNEGYKGFSDYSIVGNEFSESGYAPYAVTIHIVYFDIDKNLRVRHFVSDSNEDISNPAKKFYEALSKLANWQHNMNLKTYAMDKFMKYYDDQAYPGLGTVKKLSIMHHIELISRYLNRELK